MVVEPEATPVAMPRVGSMVPIAVLLLLHVPEPHDPVRVTEAPGQTVGVEGTTGEGPTLRVKFEDGFPLAITCTL
jgi:hypothetical protein